MTDSMFGNAAPPAVRAAVRAAFRPLYLQALTLAFALFNSARLLSYLPTLWAIHTSGDSSQHSLWTWACWFGANLTMAASLYEQNGRRCEPMVLMNLGNALMCGATIVLIGCYRVGGAS